MNLTPRIDKTDQNFLMNGHINHWLRKKLFSFVGANTEYTCDRFFVSQVGYTTLNATVSRSTDTPTIAESKFNFNYSLQYTVNTSESTPASSYITLNQRIENLIYNQIVTDDIKISFWVKSSIVGDYTLYLSSSTGTPYQFYKTKFTIDSANTWEKKVISIPKMDTPSLFSSAPYMEVAIELSNGNNNLGDTGNDQWVTDHLGQWGVSTQAKINETASATFNITGCKLAISNSDSTDQEFSLHNGSHKADLDACGRYFEKSYDYDTDIGTATYNGVHFYSITLLNSAIRQYSFYINYRYPKRIIPTTIVYSPNTGGANLIGTAAGDKVASYANAGEKGIKVQTADTVAQTSMIWAAHYSANAEL